MSDSSSDPMMLLVVGVLAIVGAFAALIFATFVVIPVAAVGIGAVLLYRYVQLQKLRTHPEHVPATIRDRPNHPTPHEFSENAVALLEDQEGQRGRRSSQPLVQAFQEIAGELYRQESFNQPPLKPDTLDRITLARYQDTLEAWQRKVSDENNISLVAAAIVSAHIDMSAYLPPYAFTQTDAPSKLSAELQFTDDSQAAVAITAVYLDQFFKDRKLFTTLRQQLDENGEDGRQFDFVNYFAGTPYTSLRYVQLPIVLPDETRFAGMWVIAPQGRGKTTLLHTLVAQDLERDASIILMDSKGDLIEPFLKLASIRNRLVVIGPDNPVGLNPLDIPKTDINKAVDNLEYIFSSLLEFKLSPTQSMLLKAVLRALITAFKEPTLETFREILANNDLSKYQPQINQLEPDLQDFFKKEWTTDNIRSRRQEVLQRLRLLLDNDTMRKMLLAPLTTFHIGEAMDRGKVVIIDNSKGKLGEQAAEFLGRFFIAQVLAAAQERSFRPRHTKKPVFFYIDEAHSVIARDHKITTVLHECRSQNIGLILAHQETAQLSDYVLSAVENCAIRFANPDEEALKLMRSLRLDLDTLRNLKRGQFAAYIRDFSKEGLIINVEQTDFSHVAQLPPPRAQIDPPKTHEPPPFDDGSRPKMESPVTADDEPIVPPADSSAKDQQDSSTTW